MGESDTARERWKQSPQVAAKYVKAVATVVDTYSRIQDKQHEDIERMIWVAVQQRAIVQPSPSRDLATDEDLECKPLE